MARPIKTGRGKGGGDRDKVTRGSLDRMGQSLAVERAQE